MIRRQKMQQAGRVCRFCTSGKDAAACGCAVAVLIRLQETHFLTERPSPRAPIRTKGPVNWIAGSCYKCGNLVPAKEGQTLLVGRRWHVLHTWEDPRCFKA